MDCLRILKKKDKKEEAVVQSKEETKSESSKVSAKILIERKSKTPETYYKFDLASQTFSLIFRKQNLNEFLATEAISALKKNISNLSTIQLNLDILFISEEIFNEILEILSNAKKTTELEMTLFDSGPDLALPNNILFLGESFHRILQTLGKNLFLLTFSLQQEQLFRRLSCLNGGIQQCLMFFILEQNLLRNSKCNLPLSINGTVNYLECFRCTPTLKYLNIQLECKNLEDAYVDEITASLNQLPLLELFIVDLSRNQLTGQSLIPLVQKLASTASNITEIELNFNWNEIGFNQGVLLVQALFLFKKLKILRLNMNSTGISFEQWIKIASDLFFLVYLDEFFISTGYGLQKIQDIYRRIETVKLMIFMNTLHLKAYFKHIAPYLLPQLVKPIYNHWDFYF